MSRHARDGIAGNRTGETFRRRRLRKSVQDRSADHNPFEANLPTNSPRTRSAITEAAPEAVRRYGKGGWDVAAARIPPQARYPLQRPSARTRTQHGSGHVARRPGPSAFAGLGTPSTNHDKLPDIVLHDPERNWPFPAETVISHDPMTPKRIFGLGEMVSACPAAAVHVGAFPDFGEFRKRMKAIAWETEVRLSDAPDQMIRYDGDRSPGPRET